MADSRGSVFSLARRGNFAAERCRKQLHAIADSQDGTGALKKECGKLGRTRIVNAAGSTRKHVTGRSVPIDALGGAVMGEDFGVNAELANAPGDQLRILGTKINDSDAARF